MGRFTKTNIGIVAAFVVVVACLAGVLTYAAVTQSRARAIGEPPTDAVMLRYFQEHEREFAQLLEMYQTDPSLDERAVDLESDSVSDPRLKEYMDLMDRLGVDWTRPSEAGGVQFTTSSYGIVSSGWYKGYLYSDLSPSPLVSNISEAGYVDGLRYRRIEGSWYLFEWDF